MVADFRVKNPSDVPFVVRTATTRLDPVSGEPVDGTPISKPDVENVFKYEKLLGPKYNDVLSIEDQIAPHQTVDRMVGARFEMGESAPRSAQVDPHYHRGHGRHRGRYQREKVSYRTGQPGVFFARYPASMAASSKTWPF